jgi:citrate/tricarballylate utilization protein
MVWTASAVSLLALAALVIGVVRFVRDAGAAAVSPAAFAAAVRDAVTLRYLGGGGHGCNDASERFSTTRRRFHHAMALGFVLCFASTSVATLYHHLLGWVAPYAWTSLPVLLGTAGGIGIVIGCTGLLWLKLTEDGAPTARRATQMDVAFLVLLHLVASSGLLLLALRTSSLMGSVLVVHLGLVLALFLLLPYSKFVHALYRFAALLRFARERLEGKAR